MERFEEVYASKTESQEVIDSLLLETPLIFHRDHEGTTPPRGEQEEEKWRRDF